MFKISLRVGWSRNVAVHRMGHSKPPLRAALNNHRRNSVWRSLTNGNHTLLIFPVESPSISMIVLTRVPPFFFAFKESAINPHVNRARTNRCVRSSNAGRFVSHSKEMGCNRRSSAPCSLHHWIAESCHLCLTNLLFSFQIRLPCLYAFPLIYDSFISSNCRGFHKLIYLESCIAQNEDLALNVRRLR